MRAFDFTIPGPPVSAQTHNRERLHSWQERVRQAAVDANPGPPTEDRDLEIVVTNYHESSFPTLDGDNMLKPIVDALQGIVFINDRQVVSHQVHQRDLNGPFIVRGVPYLVAIAFHVGDEFLHVVVRNLRNLAEVPR